MSGSRWVGPDASREGGPQQGGPGRAERGGVGPDVGRAHGREGQAGAEPGAVVVDEEVSSNKIGL